MASDVEDVTTFYANLPSIFENNTSSSNEPSNNTTIADVNKEKSYQPIFGSFLFSNSDPLSKAAFVTSSSSLSSSPSIEMEKKSEHLIKNSSFIEKENISCSVQMTSSPSLSSSPLCSTPIDDIDEDDFDGIPIRHASNMINKDIENQSNKNHLLNQSTQQNDNDIEDESFLNGFNDEQHDTIIITETETMGPSLFKDIPDIDDPNQHEDDDGQIPFDHMDLYDQSDSIRSSSPDSLLSSSHLQDDEDIDDDVDVDVDDNDDVAQWNDDNILNNTTSNKSLPFVLNVNPFDQVDFIDSSRSHSRCSNASSHLSNGYTDQARIFMSDDGLVTSSDSDENDIQDDINDFNLNQNDNDELCLQVNLDDRRSLSSLSNSSDSHSSLISPLPDQTPIVDIDQDIDESKTDLQIAPIAKIDDEDNEISQPYLSKQFILPINKKTIFDLTYEQRQNEIVHDIINMRHLFDENNNDDEFIAIMHNPRIFEQVLYENENNEQKKSDLVKQTNSVTSTFRPSLPLSIDNEIKQDSFKHHENIEQMSSLLQLNNEKILSSSIDTRKDTTTTTIITAAENNFSSSSSDSHLTKNDEEEKKKNDANENNVNTTDILNIKQKTAQNQSQQTNIFNINNEDFSTMNIVNESDDDDSELMNTLSQIHGLVNINQSSTEKTNQVDSQYPHYSSDIIQPNRASDFSSKNSIINGNQTTFLYENMEYNSEKEPSYTDVIDTMKKSHEEQEENEEKKSVIFHKNHNHHVDEGSGCDDDGDDDKYKKKSERKEEGKEKKSTTFFSLTSTTSPILFNDDSHSTVDPDTSSSLPNLLLLPLNELNNSTSFTNQLNTDESQISNTKSNMDKLINDDDFSQQTSEEKTTTTTTKNLFDPFAPFDQTMNDDIFVDKNQADVKEFGMDTNFLPSNTNSTQPLGDYNFDDLWNQSMSHIVSSNNNNEIESNDNNDPNAFSWDAFLNTNQETKNPFDDNTIVPTTTNLTWESLFGDEKQDDNYNNDQNDLKQFLDWILSHLDQEEQIDSQSDITFASTHNLETIMKDIEISSMPFEPIPSPPLHVDHTVSNPMINGIHHELFPIDELEQLNTNQQPQSMILYEVDEEENNEKLSFDEQVKPIVENLVSNVLQTAMEHVYEYYQPIEQFVDQILAQAVFEIYNEENLSTENLQTIVGWHKQLPDPLDKKFNDVWAIDFQQTNENENENKKNIDPSLTATTPTVAPTNEGDPMGFFSKTIDESELFSSTSNAQENEHEEATTLSEYIPPPLLTNPSNAPTGVNNLMKYTLTVPVYDDSGDDSSMLEDYMAPHKDDSLTTTNENINEPSSEIIFRDLTNEKKIEVNEEDNFFSNPARLSQFQVFASDQPLNSPEIESKFSDLNAQFDEKLQTDESPWTKLEKPNEANDNEPWELEESNAGKNQTEIFTNFSDQKFETNQNFFSDSFNPPTHDDHFLTNQFNENSEEILTKSKRLDDDDDQSSIIKDIKTKYPIESNELSKSQIKIEDLPPPLPSLPILDFKTNTTNDNIPLKSTQVSSNTDAQLKINLRSESEITPNIETTADVKERSHTDVPTIRSFESALLRSTSKDETVVDTDEVEGVISCIIDNIPVNIDAKTIAPFKCIINSAGTLREDNNTAVIAIYGCWLPDHRLREYRYIMDQLFYYVYHKLDKLVTNDYILIYFHGATPKHRTPDLKFLRKCYQLINFRLRKNLRAVYVVHPTRWLRTIIALARPFFSNKFYRKINYLYTIAELERQFPYNRLSIPVAIEQFEQSYRAQ